MHVLIRVAVGALGVSWLAHAALAASFTVGASLPLQASPPGYTPVSLQGFDPSLGTLRCISIAAGVTHHVEGFLDMMRPPHCSGSTGPATSTVCIGASASIGGFDATGFVGHAGAAACDEIVGSLAQGQVFNFVPYSVDGSAFQTTLVTNPVRMLAYTGAGPVGFYCGRTTIEDQVSQAGACHGVGVAIDAFSAGASFAVTYIYTPMNRCPGDTNSDGVVDFLDLNGVLGSYAETGPCARGDVNNDNVVDFLDLNEILGYYGAACAN